MSGIRRKAVVTGLGAISSLGTGVPALLEGLRAGNSGLERKNIEGRDYSVGSVKDFNAKAHGTHLLDPFIQYAVAASAEAIEDAGVQIDAVDPYRIGLSVSSSKGGMYTLSRFKDRLNNHPSAILGARVYTSMVPNFAAQWIARRWKIKGPAKCYISACATGTTSVIEGAKMIEDGIVDYCIAGASDASIVPLMLAGYKNMKVLTPDAMRPFDKNRRGFFVGEGAGIVMLEAEKNARTRGAHIYGKVSGGFYGADAYHPIYFSEEESALAKTLERALRDTGKDVDYVNLHGTATSSGDVYETHQIKKAFGKKAYEIPMSATKAMTGHMLGASGALEVIISLLAMRHNFVPPTIGLENPDQKCDLDYVPLKSRPVEVNKALSLSMGFGGHVAVIALEKVENE